MRQNDSAGGDAERTLLFTPEQTSPELYNMATPTSTEADFIIKIKDALQQMNIATIKEAIDIAKRDIMQDAIGAIQDTLLANTLAPMMNAIQDLLAAFRGSIKTNRKLEPELGETISESPRTGAEQARSSGKGRTMADGCGVGAATAAASLGAGS